MIIGNYGNYDNYEWQWRLPLQVYVPCIIHFLWLREWSKPMGKHTLIVIGVTGPVLHVHGWHKNLQLLFWRWPRSIVCNFDVIGLHFSVPWRTTELPSTPCRYSMPLELLASLRILLHIRKDLSSSSGPGGYLIIAFTNILSPGWGLKSQVKNHVEE